MAIALFSFFRSLLPRRVRKPLPTMHSLRPVSPQRQCVRVVQARGRLVISGYNDVPPLEPGVRVRANARAAQELLGQA